MTIIGTPSEWADLIDPMLPDILDLVVTTWRELTPVRPTDKEDHITLELCKALRRNRSARALMFQIHTQLVELEPQAGQDLGRMDIVFVPSVPREDVYFCLECKRLNVVADGVIRPYASEYVRFGMVRFVSGQYARAARHGGMLGYVLNGDTAHAIATVENNIRLNYQLLCMQAPGSFAPSAILQNNEEVRETRHQRAHETHLFFIHHLFVPGVAETSAHHQMQSVGSVSK